MKNVIALLGVAALLSACGHPSPPVSLAPPVVAPPLPPPPPPAPRCEGPSEGCMGKKGTMARVRKSGFSIGVPNGWTYAQMEDATIISTDEATMVVSTFEMGAGQSREGALIALVNLLGVSPPKHPVVWERALKKSKVGGLDVLFWQADDVTKGLEKGPILVFGAELPDKTWLMGVGFVPDDDRSDADRAILGAVESITPTQPQSSTVAP